MDLNGLPPIPLDLLVALELRYPEACAEPGQTMDELMFYGGKRDLVRWLRLAYTQQNAKPEEIEEDDNPFNEA